MKPYYKNKIAIVTGAASGIGRELTVQLLSCGATVVAADVNLPGLEQLKSEQRLVEGQLHIEQLDVTDRAACEALIQGVATAQGKLDFMFNNAGICIFGEVKNMTPDQWDRIIDINIRGVVHGTDIAYKIMCEQKSGHIVNTASGAGLMPIPLMTAYCTTKHAVVGLSAALREEGKRYNVNVTAICPGIISTNIMNATESHDFNMQKLHASSPAKEVSVEAAVNIILKETARNKSKILFPRDIKLITKSYALMPEAYSFLAQLGLGSLLKRK